MPLMFLPNDDVLKALGKLTLMFAELEFYVNECLIWLHLPKTEQESKDIRNREFNRRAKDLKDTLRARSATLWQDPSFKPPIEFAPSLTDLADQRNLLTHGIALTVVETQENKPIGKTYKFSSRSQKRLPLDDPKPIDELTAKVERVAEQAQFLALNLQIELQQKRGSETLPG